MGYAAVAMRLRLLLVILCMLAAVPSSAAMLYGNLNSDQVPRISLTAAELDALASRDIVVIVDKSSSMAHKDCPSGLGPADSSMSPFEWICANMGKPITRWEWCFRQVAAMVQQLACVSRDGITVVLFDSNFSTHHYERAKDVVALFAGNRPGGRTDLAPALRSQLATYSAKRWGAMRTKPLLVAVLTDGHSRDADEVKTAIAEVTAATRLQHHVQIVFVSVGMEHQGDAFLRELDSRFEIVHYTDFNEVAKIGLAKKLSAIATTTPAHCASLLSR
jgi:hypothetical protein